MARQPKRVPLATEQAMARDYADGVTLQGLRERYGFGWHPVMRALRRQNVTMRPRGKPGDTGSGGLPDMRSPL